MTAWLLDKISSIDALRMSDMPDPTPGPGEALLRIEYAALNPADRYLAQGEYPAKPAFPHILGRDAVGTIVAVGPGVSDVRAGERRMLLRSEIGVNRPGTFAQLCAIPTESLVPIPNGWSDQQAGGAALVYLTAYQALTMWEDLKPGIVLVTGASGGVGVASVQLAKAMGHRVIALSRDAKKSEKLRELGADLVLNPNDQDWTKEAKSVDLAVDNIGGPLFNQVLRTLADRGRVSCVGRLAGPVPEFNTAGLFFRRLRIGGVAVGAYTPRESRVAWTMVLKSLERIGATPLVDSVCEFDKLKDAFARLAQGPMGKVLLRVPNVTSSSS
jgi:NADPH2:quinone reductase